MTHQDEQKRRILWDTHAHLADETFEADVEEVIERARREGVEQIVVVGYTAESSRQAVDLAHRYGLRAAVGLHPNYLNDASGADWDEIVRLVEDQDHVVAIGETGLDAYRDHVPLRTQREWFVRHLELATVHHKPVVVHCRDAGQELIDIFQHTHPLPTLVLHAFGENERVLREALEAGAYISFAGNVTYRNRKFQPLHALVAAVPSERLLVETDSPYLAPEPHRGKRNEPAYVRYTVERLAELRGEPVETICRVVRENARQVFAVDP